MTAAQPRRLSRAQAVLNAEPRSDSGLTNQPQADANQRSLKRQVLEQATFLVVEEVAELLHASTDTIRRIPRSELPAHAGPGRPLIYLLDDVVAYIKKQPTTRRRMPDTSGQTSVERERGKNVVAFDIDAAIQRVSNGGAAK